MHKLNGQWIEAIDGVEHMVKSEEGTDCSGCECTSNNEYLVPQYFSDVIKREIEIRERIKLALAELQATLDIINQEAQS